MLISMLSKNVELDKVLPVQRLLLGPLQHLGGGHVDLRQSRNRRGHGIPRLELGRDGGEVRIGLSIVLCVLSTSNWLWVLAVCGF